VEFGFNLAWLVLSVALSIGWGWSANRATHHHAHRASFLALVILIALLFPVVSISDDLHEDQANITSEEPRYKDDLQHQIKGAHLQAEHFPLALDLALAVAVPAFKIVRSEEDHGLIESSLVSRIGFPPTLHDLPPPVQA